MVKKNLQSGVTLVELMVVIGIFAVISTVLVFNYSDFSANVSIRYLAQEIGMTVRKAQTYATSVRRVDASGGTSDSFPTYGISFTVGRDDGGAITATGHKRFIMFADIVPSGGSADRVYNDGDQCGSPVENNECLESFGINSSDTIVELCTDLTDCMDDVTVNVLFHRPAPDADICIVEGGSCRSDKPSYLDVVVESVKGIRKTVTIWNTGQISVK